MTKRDTLISQVSRATPENLPEIFNDVRDYCDGAKGRGKPLDFVQYIHPMVKALLPEEVLTSISQNAETKEEGFGKKLSKCPAMQKEFGEKILEPKFKKIRGDEQDDFFCLVANPEHQILIRLTRAGAECAMEDAIAQYMTKHHATLSTSLVTEIRKQFVRHTRPIAKPEPACRHDELKWCYHKPLLEIAHLPIPYCRSILDRMSDPEAFAAWFWGVYSGDYQGRRVLWLHGPHGEDGKSLILKTLADALFGKAAAAISNAMLNGSEKRFVTSVFEHSRLVIYPDANNTHIFRSELFKTIASAGSDMVSIERKGEQAYTGVLSARLAVGSNYAPFSTSENFVISRILYIHIKPHNEAPDPSIKEKLIEELPGFLHYAKQCWEKLNIKNYDIKINPETQVLFDEIVGGSSEEYNQVFANLFEQSVDDKNVITGKSMKILLESEGIKSSQDQADFHNWLIREKGVKKIKISPSNTYIYTNLVKAGHGKKATGGSGRLDFSSV